MANKTKIRWYLYRELKKRDIIYARKGGFPLNQLMGFIHSYYGVDLSVYKESSICKAFRELCNKEATFLDNLILEVKFGKYPIEA